MSKTRDHSVPPQIFPKFPAICCEYHCKETAFGPIAEQNRPRQEFQADRARESR